MSVKRVNRVYSEEQKQQVLQEVKAVGNVPVVGKKHGISPNTIHTWLKKARGKSEPSPTAEPELMRLKKQLSEKEVENQILKDLLKKTYAVWKTD